MAVGERDAGVGARPERRRDARDDLEPDAGLSQRRRLLAPAAEDERVPGLEAHDVLAGEGPFDDVRMYGRTRAVPSPAPDRQPLCRRGDAIEDLGRDQFIEGHDLGLGQQLRPTQREEPGVAGAGTHQVDGTVARHEGLSSGAVALLERWEKSAAYRRESGKSAAASAGPTMISAVAVIRAARTFAAMSPSTPRTIT